MPSYRLTYEVESRIENSSDIELLVSDHVVSMRFATKLRDSAVVDAIVDVEADSARQAQAQAAGVLLPHALDALSFTTGAPQLVRDCKLILKNETGSRARRALYVNVTNWPDPILVTRRSVEEAQQILNTRDARQLSLAWHRYAAQRRYSIDRFLFQWLAFEALLGTSNISIACPECGATRSHSGTDKNRAFDLFHECNTIVDRNEFRERIWGKARNEVFHGQAYPEPSFLVELNERTAQLRKTCDRFISREFGISEDARIMRGEVTWRLFLFVEWDTDDPDAGYASDFPEAAVSRLGGRHAHGEVGVNEPAASGFRLLDMNRDYSGW